MDTTMAKQGARPRSRTAVPKKEQFWRVANPAAVELQQKFGKKAGPQDSRPHRERTRQNVKKSAIKNDGW